jgi:hypothetical protein
MLEQVKQTENNRKINYGATSEIRAVNTQRHHALGIIKTSQTCVNKWKIWRQRIRIKQIKHIIYKHFENFTQRILFKIPHRIYLGQTVVLPEVKNRLKADIIIYAQRYRDEYVREHDKKKQFPRPVFPQNNRNKERREPGVGAATENKRET